MRQRAILPFGLTSRKVRVGNMALSVSIAVGRSVHRFLVIGKVLVDRIKRPQRNRIQDKQCRQVQSQSKCDKGCQQSSPSDHSGHSGLLMILSKLKTSHCHFVTIMTEFPTSLCMKILCDQNLLFISQ